MRRARASVAVETVSWQRTMGSRCASVVNGSSTHPFLCWLLQPDPYIQQIKSIGPARPHAMPLHAPHLPAMTSTAARQSLLWCIKTVCRG